ncbi:hypothetical protein BGY98DRAFT_936102 [Russula aff. rugulosa BPL654]|nr:hypothetical protein BGY98DRAFT_936102 [Russula aff. rugulosa BPL654]
MLSKSFAASIFLLALTSSVNAQGSGCVFAPALANANPGAGDVQHPSSSAPCGDVNISQNIDSSTPVPLDSSMQFNVQVTSFGTGTGNSRSIMTAKVDPTATGASFVECQVVANGDANPQAAGTQTATLQLPDGTECTGGTSGKLCLVSISNEAGDGNCMVLSQADTTTQSSTATNGGKPQTNAQTNQNQANGNNGGQNGGQANTNPNTGNTNQKRMIRKRKL